VATSPEKRELARAKLKTAAYLRAELSYKQALERIDHRIDTVRPALEELDFQAEMGKPVKALEPGDPR
jgi:hypothetical protein